MFDVWICCFSILLFQDSYILHNMEENIIHDVLFTNTQYNAYCIVECSVIASDVVLLEGEREREMKKCEIYEKLWFNSNNQLLLFRP